MEDLQDFRSPHCRLRCRTAGRSPTVADASSVLRPDRSCQQERLQRRRICGKISDQLVNTCTRRWSSSSSHVRSMSPVQTWYYRVAPIEVVLVNLKVVLEVVRASGALIEIGFTYRRGVSSSRLQLINLYFLSRVLHVERSVLNPVDMVNRWKVFQNNLKG